MGVDERVERVPARRGQPPLVLAARDAELVAISSGGDLVEELQPQHLGLGGRQPVEHARGGRLQLLAFLARRELAFGLGVGLRLLGREFERHRRAALEVAAVAVAEFVERVAPQRAPHVRARARVIFGQVRVLGQPRQRLGDDVLAVLVASGGRGSAPASQATSAGALAREALERSGRREPSHLFPRRHPPARFALSLPRSCLLRSVQPCHSPDLPTSGGCGANPLPEVQTLGRLWRQRTERNKVRGDKRMRDMAVMRSTYANGAARDHRAPLLRPRQ